MGGIMPWRPLRMLVLMASGVPPYSQSSSVRLGKPTAPVALDP